MTNNNIRGDLQAFSNSQSQLQECGGAAVAVEILMRMIAEKSRPVQAKIKEYVKQDNEKKNKNNEKESRKIKDNYWDCNFQYIEKAIIDVFGDKLSPDERSILDLFRKIRNKLVHGDLVGMMNKMNILPESREVLRDGRRKILEKQNIIEAIKVMDSRGTFSKVKNCIADAENIASNIFCKLANE
jgi:hypothetical protein